MIGVLGPNGLAVVVLPNPDAFTVLSQTGRGTRAMPLIEMSTPEEVWALHQLMCEPQPYEVDMHVLATQVALQFDLTGPNAAKAVARAQLALSVLRPDPKATPEWLADLLVVIWELKEQPKAWVRAIYQFRQLTGKGLYAATQAINNAMAAAS